MVALALSHALAGPSEVRAGALHVSSAEEVTRRSCRGFPDEPVSPVSPVAVLLHPARMSAKAARTVGREINRAFVSSL